MNRPTHKIVLMIALLQGCSSLPSQGDRVLLGVGAGGASGAAGGAVLSPNEESKGLNTFVFALTGAVLGGLIGFFTSSASDASKQNVSLEAKERASSPSTKEYVVSPMNKLPDFLKDRIHPAVVEEYIEADQIGEDGSLHSPHKVYRIKHPAELIARPKPDGNTEN